MRLVVLIIAALCAVAAIALVKDALDSSESQVETSPRQVTVIEQVEKSEVLVAARDLRTGESLREDTLLWQVWPTDSVSPAFITKSTQPSARSELGSSVVKNHIVAGEPITEAKILRLDNASVMSVRLRRGMRAISVPITPETGAGGFILPGDHVDVLLTAREVNFSQSTRRSETVTTSRTLLERVRVLAVDQVFIDEGNEGAAVIGTTATLEVLPEQAPVIARAEDTGVITLTLRGLSELMDDDGNVIENPMPITVKDENDSTESIHEDRPFVVLRNGQVTRVLPGQP